MNLSRLAAATVVGAALALTACGGGDSKPAYCTDRNNLEASVKDLGNVAVLGSGGVQKLQSQLQKIEDNALSLASSAKSDFPTESSALQTSITTLKTAVNGLSASATPAQVATTAAAAKSVVSAFNTFKKATDSKCS
jgi:hypothetical protein